MEPVVASIPVDLFWLWHDHADAGRSTTVQRVWLQGGVVKYFGIDRCDECGRPLEQGQGLVGLCKACEKAADGGRAAQEPVAASRISDTSSVEKRWSKKEGGH